MTPSMLYMGMLIASIVIVIYALIIRSSIGIMIGLILGFIAAYFVFNLGQYQQMKNVKIVFDTIGNVFRNR